MALQKEFMTDSGVTVSYWVIGRINIDRDNKVANILVSPYVSKSARDAGKKPFDSAALHERVEDITYNKNPDDPRSMMFYTQYFSETALHGMDLYSTAYTYLKERIPFFHDAEDV